MYTDFKMYVVKVLPDHLQKFGRKPMKEMFLILVLEVSAPGKHSRLDNLKHQNRLYRKPEIGGVFGTFILLQLRRQDKATPKFPAKAAFSGNTPAGSWLVGWDRL